jgi:hypothetical protein
MPHDTRPVSFRLSNSDYEKLDREAAARGMSVGSLARHRALRSLGQDPPKRRTGPTRDSEELRLVTVALGKLGGNVNQLSRRANATGVLPALEVLERVLAEISAIRRLLIGALGVDQKDP